MIVVWHNHNLIESRLKGLLSLSGLLENISADALTPVAIVDMEDPSNATRRVMDRDNDWEDDPKIHVLDSSRKSIFGDIIQTTDGSFFLILWSGLKQLDKRHLPLVEAITKEALIRTIGEFIKQSCLFDQAEQEGETKNQSHDLGKLLPDSDKLIRSLLLLTLRTD